MKMGVMALREFHALSQIVHRPFVVTGLCHPRYLLSSVFQMMHESDETANAIRN
jgi:hypothetical protein